MGPINGSLLDGLLKRGFVFRHTVRSEIGKRVLSSICRIQPEPDEANPYRSGWAAVEGPSRLEETEWFRIRTKRKRCALT